MRPIPRKKGVGALIITFDIDELSVLNGIAGSYAEHIPVIAITGAYKQFTETQALLGFENAGAEIDRALTTVIIKRRPVYISLPLDVAHSMISERGINCSKYRS